MQNKSCKQELRGIMNSNMSSKLRFALEIGPLLVFFLGYRFADLMVATAALIIFTALSLLITYVYEKRIATMPLISGVAVAIFGGMTLFLQNEDFIKIKPTVANILFATIILGGVYFKKNLLKYIFGSALSLSEEGWRIFSKRWGFFFLFLAALNEVIWRNFSTDFWVDFKVVGMLSCTIIFTLCQLPLLKKHALTEPSK